MFLVVDDGVGEFDDPSVLLGAGAVCAAATAITFFHTDRKAILG